jgi:tetratricopeptide (TPR) repeat protein
MDTKFFPCILAAVLATAACTSETPVQGGHVQPSSQIFTGSDITPHVNQEGSLILFTFDLPGGNKGAVKWMPMTRRTTRGRPADTTASNEYEMAIARVTQLIAENPGNLEAYLQRAALLFDRGGPGDYDKAIEDCDKVLSIQKNALFALYIRGLVYAKKGENERAAADLNALLSINANEVKGIYYVLGQIYANMGQKAAAIESLEKVLSIDPDFADTRTVLEMLRR